MTAQHALSLRVVDGRALPEPVRHVLRPGAVLRDRDGHARRLPRFFYEVPSWEVARGIVLAPAFKLSEFLHVDVREAAPLRGWPRYVPCAITLLAAHLALFREAVDTYVHVAANGAYRSPGHALGGAEPYASTHLWGTAANIYRIGDDWLDTPEAVERYREVVRRVIPGVWTRPYGSGPGYADDHLHLDLGYAVLVPHGAPGEVPSGEAPAAEASSAASDAD